MTGQAAVETDMFVDALTALASDPSVGLVAFDAFPPRLPGETPWADPVLSKAIELQRSTGVAFVSLCMSPLAYTDEAQGLHEAMEAAAVPAGAPGVGQRDPRAARVPGRAAAGGARACRRTRTAAKALRVLRGASGPVDEATGAALLELYGVRRPKEAVVATPAQAAAAAAKIRGPVAVKALAPGDPAQGASSAACDSACAAPAEVEAAAAEVLAAARRGGARAPKVLVQEMVHGHEVLVGAIVDEQFGATITIRPGGALAEAGEATFVAAPLTAQAGARLRGVPGRALRSQRRRARPRRGGQGGRVDRPRRPTICAIGSPRSRPTRCWSGPRGAVAVDALAEAKPPA